MIKALLGLDKWKAEFDSLYRRVFEAETAQAKMAKTLEGLEARLEHRLRPPDDRDWSIIAGTISQMIGEFEDVCSGTEYTDTGDAWVLLFKIWALVDGNRQFGSALTDCMKTSVPVAEAELVGPAWPWARKVLKIELDAAQVKAAEESRVESSVEKSSCLPSYTKKWTTVYKALSANQKTLVDLINYSSVPVLYLAEQMDIKPQALGSVLRGLRNKCSAAGIACPIESVYIDGDKPALGKRFWWVGWPPGVWGSLAERRLTSTGNRILEVLKDVNGWIKVSDLAKGAGVHPATARRYLDRWDSFIDRRRGEVRGIPGSYLFEEAP